MRLPQRTAQNIPIECVRALVAVAEAGSLSKAADRLGLSQPAVSAQVKRIQTLVGGELFVKTANGTSMTELGKLALQQARRILDANDQIMGLGGAETRPLRRLGIASSFAKQLFISLDEETRSKVFLSTDHSSLIRKGIVEGYIDVGCLFAPDGLRAEIEEAVVWELPCPITWVKSRNFVLSPGAPIPVISLPEDDWLIRALQRRGLPYRIVLKSSEHLVREEAVRAGIGLSVMPQKVVSPDLVKAEDSYLPRLDDLQLLVCIRNGLDSADVLDLARKVSEVLFPAEELEDGASAGLPSRTHRFTRGNMAS